MDRCPRCGGEVCFREIGDTTYSEAACRACDWTSTEWNWLSPSGKVHEGYELAMTLCGSNADHWTPTIVEPTCGLCRALTKPEGE